MTIAVIKAASPTVIRPGENTAEAIRQAALATTAKDQAVAALASMDNRALASYATDARAQAAFTDIVISDGEDGDTYFLNYEFSYFSGTPLYRVKIRLHSVNRGGVEVARSDFQQAANPSTNYPATIHLTRRANGSAAFGTDYGVTATIEVNWNAVIWTASGNVTTHTDAVATRVRDDRVVTPEETKAKWLSPALPAKRLMTVGSSGDFASLDAALDYIEFGGFAAPYTRSTYPATHMCSPEYPLTVRVTQTGYTEQAELFVESTIHQSRLRIHHGMHLHLPYRDTLIYADTAGNTGPVLEMNLTGRIDGAGRIEQRQGGYTIHIDAAGNIITEFVRELQSVLMGVTIRKLVSDTLPLIGLGIGSGQTVLLDGVRLERPSNTSNGPYIAGHNSPNETHGGLLHLRNLTSDIAGTAAMIAMDKTTASPARHGIIVENSDCPRITISNTAGGTSGFIRKSPMAGTVITGTMEP